MKTKRRKKRAFDAEFKAWAVDRVLRGRANRSETQRAIADELDVTENQLSAWVRASGRKDEKSRRSRQSPGEVVAVEAPTLELRGLRAWVNHAVRLEVDRYLALKEKRE